MQGYRNRRRTLKFALRQGYVELAGLKSLQAPPEIVRCTRLTSRILDAGYECLGVHSTQQRDHARARYRILDEGVHG